MRLDELLHAVAVTDVVGDASAVDVTNVVHDSRAVGPGALFCCVPGGVVDGHDFAASAVGAGAVALLCEHRLPLDIVQAVVPSTRAAMGPVASTFHGEPSRALDVIGVTGTNGKTTTTHLLHAILEACGRPARVIGTLTGARTTPEGPELQAQLASFRDEGVRAVAMEVSSHALVQHRVDGTRFRVGVFTNLSRDHLDFHHTMEEYFAAKAMLFEPERCVAAVVNVDDPWGARLAERLEIPWVPCSLSLVDDVDVQAEWSECQWEGVRLRVPLGGRFNLSNGLAAAIAAKSVGLAPADIARGIATAGQVPGRFEAVQAGQPFHVIVDYAHTPDGIEQLLASARELAAGHRVVIVFGAGGDRDRSKRAPMGAAAAEGADLVVVTSDNPRGERPSAIIEDVLKGVPHERDVLVEPDRRSAIATALAAATDGDVVVIAGKGHETTQTIGDTTSPFDDRAVARELLEGRTWSAS